MVFLMPQFPDPGFSQVWEVTSDVGERGLPNSPPYFPIKLGWQLPGRAGWR